MTLSPEERRKATSMLLTDLHINRHHALMAWAKNNHARWQQWKLEAIVDSFDWHVAEVESAYWQTIIEMLKERAQ